jgi:hypothetical protein
MECRLAGETNRRCTVVEALALYQPCAAYFLPVEPLSSGRHVHLNGGHVLCGLCGKQTLRKIYYSVPCFYPDSKYTLSLD